MGSEKKSFKDFLYYNINSRDINYTLLAELVHTIAHTKYRGSRPYGFKENDFSILHI